MSIFRHWLGIASSERNCTSDFVILFGGTWRPCRRLEIRRGDKTTGTDTYKLRGREVDGRKAYLIILLCACPWYFLPASRFINVMLRRFYFFSPHKFTRPNRRSRERRECEVGRAFISWSVHGCCPYSCKHRYKWINKKTED